MAPLPCPAPSTQLETSRPDLTLVHSLPDIPKVLLEKAQPKPLIILVQCPFDLKADFISLEGTAGG